MVALGQVAIHEIGHVFLGSGHCRFGCCFEYSAGAWRCGVRGTLGLPHGTFQDDAADDARSVVGDVSVVCGSNRNATCEVSAYGVQLSRANFCADTPDLTHSDCNYYSGIYAVQHRVCAVDDDAGAAPEVNPKPVPDVVLEVLADLFEEQRVLVHGLVILEKLSPYPPEPTGEDYIVPGSEP
jgi:hypothetical protein